MKPTVFLPSIAALCLVASTVWGAGIYVTGTGYGDAHDAVVVLQLDITDNGGAPDAVRFGVRREGVYPCDLPTTVACLERQAGTRTVTLYDTTAEPNHTYQYEVVGMRANCIDFSDPSVFALRFDPTGWGFPIIAVVTVGPDATPIAHGRLNSMHDGTLSFGFESCGGCPYVPASNFPHGEAGPDVTQYVDTGTELLLYGSVSYCCNWNGYIMHVTSATPQDCVSVAVRPQTWTGAKTLYR